MIKQTINNLLEAEMERKDFLKMVGLGLVATTGVIQVVNALSQRPKSKGILTTAKGQAYGGSPYGGTLER